MNKAFAIALLAMTACGGNSSTSTTPPASSTDVAWKDMDLNHRVEYMEHVVMPEMKRLFTEFDPKYAEMNCKTCHGPGADDTSFEMPNPDIWVLPSEQGWKTFVPSEEETKWLKFMGETVKPSMAKLLGMSDYDWQTKQGEFNCNGCHITATE